MFKTNNIDYYIKKGYDNLKKGKYDEAKENYLKGLAIKPNDIRLLNNLSQIYDLTGDEKTSLGYTELVLEECDKQLKNKKTKKLLLSKAKALIELKRKEDANLIIDELLEIDSENIVGLYLKLEYLNTVNKSTESLIYIDKILKQNPYDIGTILLKSKILIDLFEFKKAENSLKKVFEIDPQNKIAFTLKSDLIKKEEKLTLTSHDFAIVALESFENNNLNDAARYIKQALSLSSKHAELWFLQGEISIKNGMINEAIISFKKAFEIDSKIGGIKKKKSFFKMLNAMKTVSKALRYEN